MGISRPIQDVRDGLTRAILAEEVFYAFSDSSIVVNTDDLDIFVITPASEEVAVSLSFEGIGNTLLEVYEGTTVSANGTAKTIRNTRLSSSQTADTQIFEDPTITADGTKIDGVFIQGGSKNSAVGVSGSSDYPLVFKANTNYLIRINNDSGSTAVMSWHLNFIENI